MGAGRAGGHQQRGLVFPFVKKALEGDMRGQIFVPLITTAARGLAGPLVDAVGPGRAVPGLPTGPIYASCPDALSSGATARSPLISFRPADRETPGQCRREEGLTWVCIYGDTAWRRGPSCLLSCAYI